VPAAASVDLAVSASPACVLVLMKDVNAALAVRELTAASANHLVLDANEHLDRVERD